MRDCESCKHYVTKDGVTACEEWECNYKAKETKKRREEHIKALREMYDMILSSENWESMTRLTDALCAGAFALGRLNEIDFGKDKEE